MKRENERERNRVDMRIVVFYDRRHFARLEVNHTMTMKRGFEFPPSAGNGSSADYKRRDFATTIACIV